MPPLHPQDHQLWYHHQSPDQLAHHQDEAIPVACVNDQDVAGCTSCNGNTLLYVLLLVEAAEDQADQPEPIPPLPHAHPATLLTLERLLVAAVHALPFCHVELSPALPVTDAISALRDHWLSVVAAAHATPLDQFHQLLPFLFIVPVPAIVHLTNTL